MTVQDLAKGLKVPVKDIVKKLEEIGVFGANPDSPVRQEEAARVIKMITGRDIRVKKTAKPRSSKPAKALKETAEEGAAQESAPSAQEEGASEGTAVKAEANASEGEEAAASSGREKAGEDLGIQKVEGAAKSGRPVPTVRKAEKKTPAKRTSPAARSTETHASSAEEASASKGTKTSREGARPASKASDSAADVGIVKVSGTAHTTAKIPTVRHTGTVRDQAGRSSAGSRQGSRPGQNRTQGQNRMRTGRDGESRPGMRTGSYSQGRRPGQGAEGSVRVPGRRPATGRRGEGRADTYDMGLSAPERHPSETAKKGRGSGSDQRRRDRQRDSDTEQYKTRKNQLIQEANYLDDDRLARHKKKPVKKPQGTARKEEEEEIKIVALPDSMTVKELSDMLHKPLNMVIKALMQRGIMAGLNQIIDYDTAEGIATDMDILVEHQVEEDIFKKYEEYDDKPEDLEPRSPVVVVMGHVDHGKTSLLDAIRHTHVTSGEAGGITQHIGASVVEVNGRKITFLDTPGHEAFTAMRLRGAMVTDIAILVVAADDGVMPQTVEAINHAKAAGVQIIVAINKMDKPGANPERVMQELTEYDLVPEEWGGSTICVPVSALKGDGVPQLLEMVLLEADMLELKANPNGLASGSVIESELDKGRGAVATVLVQRGTLHIGDPIVVGKTYGRIKTMTDDKGRRIKKAGPSTPVEITGLSEVPEAGDHFYMTESDHEARALAEKVSARERAKLIDGNKRVNLNDLFGDIQSGDVKQLNVVVKADVQGSVEAVKQSLEKLSNDEVTVHVIHGAVGGINDSDVMLASTANAIIIGFNVRPDASAKSMAEEQKVDIRLYRVIYNAIDDITAAMKGMLAPKVEEKISGHAEVRQIFHASGLGTIAGCYVTDGKILRGSSVRLLRDNIVVFEGALASLRRFKDDVKEVNTGYECGLMLEKFNDIKEGDIVEGFTMEEVTPEA